MIDFAGHFHVHDEYSPLDGAGTRNQLSYQAVRHGQTHLGITNHGRVGGVLEHVEACRHPEKYAVPTLEGGQRGKDERLIPILGIEAFWRPDRFNWERKSSEANHLCLHAASLRGWRTLMRLSSKSWVKREKGGGFYGKAVIDLDMLENDHEDVIVSTACLLSPLSQLILAGDESGARAWIMDFKDLVGDRLWLEIMPHDLEEQQIVNIGLVNLGHDTSTPLMVTGDVHIPFRNWARTHEVLRMASYKETFTKRTEKRESGEDVYTGPIDTVFLSSATDLRGMFAKYHPDLPEYVVTEALANTSEFARQVRWYVIGKTTKAPKVDADVLWILSEWMDEGWQKMLDTYPASHWEKWPQELYEEQRAFEWGVFKEKGVTDYFYIVGDFVRWAKSTLPLPVRMPDGTLYYPEGESKKPIRVGLGRGSAAGCLISKLIGITAIDPISHKLSFERFMNPDREGYPDIDIDIASGGRDLVKEYLRIVYGHDRVADIIAYQTFAPRITIRDIGTVYEVDYVKLNEITESIGDTERGLEKIAESNELVAKFKRDFPKPWRDMCRLEHQILRDTRHAGGMVILPKETNWFVPTQTGKDQETIVTAWADRIEFPIMSNYGFLKFDILGVNSLDKQDYAVELIRQHYGEDVEPNDLPFLRDPYDVEGPVMDAFVKGLTVGIFQFSGRGITQFLRHVKPDNTVDIAAVNALYRPGAIKYAFEYGDRKKDPSKITYIHEAMEPILSETLGLIAFQEQVMEICKVIGKFTGAEADFMRKAVSKLYRLGKEEAQAEMAPFYDRFMQGCRENGIKDADGNLMWGYILEWGGYGFNRSHSDSYGLQACQDMWLKIHFPLALYASVLTTEHKAKRDEQRKFLKGTLREATYFDIEAIGPDVNRSGLGWTIDNGKLRYGLVSVTGMGTGLAQDIIDNRTYKDYDDFIERIPTGFGADKLVSLAQAGAFDEIEDRELLLSLTRQWGENVAKLKIKMTCGDIKQRTVKRKHDDDPELQAMVDEVVGGLECPNHPDATVDEVTRLDDLYQVARYFKDHQNGHVPDIVSTPSEAEISDMELNALNVSLTQSAWLLKFKPFLDERIFTDAEIEELPRHPQRKGKKHGNWCKCSACEKAQCVVGGEIINLKVIKTSRGDNMAFADLAYETNQYSCTFFPSFYSEYEELLKSQSLVMIGGFKDDRGQIVATEMADVFTLAKEQGWKPAT